MSESDRAGELAPDCRHCGRGRACLKSRTAPMLCYRCQRAPRVYEQYALPADRVLAHLGAAFDAMVLEAIERGRTARTAKEAPAPAAAAKEPGP